MVQCKECSKELMDRKGLSYHVKVIHKTQFIDYVIKHELGGVKPLCACGCGKEVLFFCGKFMSYVNGHFLVGRPKSETHRKNLSIAGKGKKQSDESNKKRSIATKRYHEQHPEFAEQISQRMKDRIVSDATKSKISKTRSSQIASGKIVINREKISDTITKKYLEGGFEWSKGKYTSTKTGKECYYRSSWERMLFEQLDSDPDVSSWESEFTTIPYTFEGNQHTYIPDLHVVRSTGHTLIEVKPQSLRSTPKNAAKREAAKLFCESRGWKYEEWES